MRMQTKLFLTTTFEPMYKRLVVVILLTLPCVVLGQARKYSNEFLNLGVGARALGLGGAFTSAVNDVTAGFWNPAALTQTQEDLQVSVMHSPYFSGISSYDYFGFSKRVGEQNAIGLSLIRFGVDNIANTYDLIQNGQINYDRVKSFSAVDWGFMGHFGHVTNDEKFSWGASTKVIHRTVGTFATAWGFGFDAGVLYKNENLKLALVGKDITFTFNAWKFNFTDAEKAVLYQTNNDIPKTSLEITSPRLIGSASYLFEFDEWNQLMPTADITIYLDGKRNTLIRTNALSIAPVFGVEYGFKKTIYVRGGLGQFQNFLNVEGKKTFSVQPNAGIGLQLKNFAIDYALTNVGNASAALYSHVFSLRLGIGEPGGGSGYGRSNRF